jgi:formylglycine-generating enzyme required for sulfatase activity
MKRILSILLLLLLLNAQSFGQKDKYYNVRGVKFAMKFIKGGTSVMGATKEMGEHDDDEVVHRVNVESFYLGETEVTQELWEAVMGKNPSKFHGENHPVE